MPKATLKLLLVALCILLFTVAAWCCLKVQKPRWRDRMNKVSARMVLRICGIRVTRTGKMASDRPLLLVSNHLSYTDVPILVSQSNIRFTPKSDIKSWPFLGWMCQVQGSVFVERKMTKVKEVGNNIKAALQSGEAVCLFPEATTGNGLHMLAFKSSFFSLADEDFGGHKLAVQPVAIAYTKIRNLPIATTQWPDIAWYGDMDLVPHLWNFLKIAPVSAHVTYLAPVFIDQFADRKALAAYCQKAIEETIKG